MFLVCSTMHADALCTELWEQSGAIFTETSYHEHQVMETLCVCESGADGMKQGWLGEQSNKLTTQGRKEKKTEMLWDRGGTSRTSEARRCQNVHVSRLEFVRPRWRHPLGLYARDLNFGRHEAGGVIHFEAPSSVTAIHRGGLLHAKVGLQREACSN